MNDFDYSGLRFDRRPVRPTTRIFWVVSAGIVFTLAWLMLPTELLYWLLLPGVLALAWAASYGWRGALAAVKATIAFLERL